LDPHVLEYIPEEDLRLFARICSVVEKLPNHDFGDPNLKQYKIKNAISCHILARALASFFPVGVASGLIQNCWEHSWLITKNGFVIDAYPVALYGGPVIVDARSCSPWYGFYGTRCSFVEHQTKEFLDRVHEVIVSIAVILQKK